MKLRKARKGFKLDRMLVIGSKQFELDGELLTTDCWVYRYYITRKWGKQ